MSISRLLTALAGVALLAGCGGSTVGPSATTIPNGFSYQPQATLDSIESVEDKKGPPQILYVSQTAWVTVYKQFGTSQVPIRTISTGVSHPEGLFVNTNGDLYVANLTGQNVTVYRRGSGKPYRTLLDRGEAPTNPVVDSTGVVYVCNFEPAADSTSDDGNITVYAPGKDKPTSTLTIAGAEFVLWCGLDAQHNLYAGYWLTSGTLGVWEFPGGSGPGSALNVQVDFPGQMEFNAKHNLVLADEKASTADTFELSTGRQIGTIATPSGGTIVGLTLNKASTRVWIADNAQSAVYEFSYPQGVLLDTIIPPAEGENPTGLAADPPAPL